MRDIGFDDFKQLCLSSCEKNEPNKIIDDENYTLLHHACRSNTASLDLVKLLIQHGAEISPRTIYHLTPLHCAVFWGEIEIIEFLISQGADINTIIASEDSPLRIAYRQKREYSTKNYLAILRLLIENGAIYDGPNQDLLEIVEKYKPDVCYL